MPFTTAPSLPLQILDENADGVLVTDLSRTGSPIVYANAAFERVTGYSCVETLGRNCRFLQGADQEQPEVAVMRDAIAAGRPVVVTLRNYRQDQSMFWNEVRLAPLREPGQSEARPRYYVGFQRDVTDRVAAEERVRQSLRVAQEANLAKHHFFKAMDHEFRTPIGLITGFSELLIDDAERDAPNAQHLSHLEDIRSAAHHLLMMVEDAGRYLGLGSSADLRRQPVLLSRVIEGAAHRIAHILQDHSANLQVSAVGWVEVDADLPMLQQALANLIAEVVRRATPQHKIVVEFCPGAERAGLEIRCPTFVLPECMFRGLGRNATGAKILNRGLEGSGVSLFVAERIIRLHGGELSIRSRSDIGTIIRVSLPQVAAQQMERKGAA